VSRKSYKKLYYIEIITKACLLRCKITHTHRLQSSLIHQNKVTRRPYLHDEICKITHTQITVIIDTSEQGNNAAISSWPDMQNHTHTSILLVGRRSCCMWSLNKLHLCWWLRELIPSLQWDHKAFWTCTFVCKSLPWVEGESIRKIMTIGQRMKDCSSWK
jgi:hypothetical protein